MVGCLNWKVVLERLIQVFTYKYRRSTMYASLYQINICACGVMFGKIVYKCIYYWPK